MIGLIDGTGSPDPPLRQLTDRYLRKEMELSGRRQKP